MSAPAGNDRALAWAGRAAPAESSEERQGRERRGEQRDDRAGRRSWQVDAAGEGIGIESQLCNEHREHDAEQGPQAMPARRGPSGVATSGPCHVLALRRKHKERGDDGPALPRRAEPAGRGRRTAAGERSRTQQRPGDAEGEDKTGGGSDGHRGTWRGKQQSSQPRPSAAGACRRNCTGISSRTLPRDAARRRRSGRCGVAKLVRRRVPDGGRS